MNKKMHATFANPAFRFVMLIGIANLFADLTYEGGGSLNGQFMSRLGATAFVISMTAGLGEFLGYSLRSLSGYLADRLGKPWLITFLGYGINLLAVPAMALVHSWPAAAVLIFLERSGRAIRKPTTEAMLSYTTQTYGAGWVYALNTALDETGATIGPLCMALVLFRSDDYRLAYALLIISSVLALVSLLIGRAKFPIPSKLEKLENSPSQSREKFSRAYWTYMVAGGVFAAGLMSYELMAYHILQIKMIGEQSIPLLLAFATGTGVLANLLLGKSFDRLGMKIIFIAILLSSAFAPLLFFGGWYGILLAMPLVGIGYAVQDTLLKAIVAKEMPTSRRSFAFGLFYTGYGFGWLLGSVASGLLYERSLIGLVIFSAAMQLLSLPIFLKASRIRSPRAH